MLSSSCWTNPPANSYMIWGKCKNNYLKVLEENRSRYWREVDIRKKEMTLCKVSPRAGPSQQLILQVAKIQIEDLQPYWFEEPQDKFKVDPATRK